MYRKKITISESLFQSIDLFLFCSILITGKVLRCGETFVTPELQELINETFGIESSECDDAQGSENGSTENIGKSRYIQMSNIPADVDALNTDTDNYCPNARPNTLFRETTV